MRRTPSEVRVILHFYVLPVPHFCLVEVARAELRRRLVGRPRRPVLAVVGAPAEGGRPRRSVVEVVGPIRGGEKRVVVVGGGAEWEGEVSLLFET